MDIQYNQLPFKLTFFEGEEQNVYEILDFYIKEEDLNEVEPAVLLRENLALKMFFECIDPNAKLYMDGLDILEEKILEEDDDGNPHLIPMDKPIELFSYRDYPLVPGYYRIIVDVGSKRYFSQIKIIPTRLTETQWECMRNELEQDLRGLAQEFVRRNLGLGGLLVKKYIPLPPPNLYRFLIIQNRFNSVMVALSDLVNKVNFKIIKEYRFVQDHKTKFIDEKTIKYKLTHPEKEGILKVPVSVINYDLPENRWIKRIIRYINVCIDEFITAIDQYINSANMELAELSEYSYQENTARRIKVKEKTIRDIYDYKNQALKIKNAIKIVEFASWYPMVKETAFDPINYNILGDSRYRSLYQLYRELKADDFEISLDSSYTYQWKRTAKLYEMWGFLKIYKTLIGEDLGYRVDKGWMSGQTIENLQFLVPELSSGTRIEMSKDDIKINLIYDGKIPYRSEDSDLSLNPIYMQGSHNRPDARVDVFKNNVYAGSLLIDFKYRKPSDFWAITKIRSSNRTKEMSQLISYGSQSSSIYLFGEIDNEYLKSDMRPVREVWAIYPKEYRNKDDNFYRDHRLRLIKLCPGEKSQNLAGYLINVIEDAILRLDRFKNKS